MFFSFYLLLKQNFKEFSLPIQGCSFFAIILKASTQRGNLKHHLNLTTTCCIHEVLAAEAAQSSFSRSDVTSNSLHTMFASTSAQFYICFYLQRPSQLFEGKNKQAPTWNLNFLLFHSENITITIFYNIQKIQSARINLVARHRNESH